jgi:hypothetical protein
MPMIIQHIDAIARQKKRDVLFVLFHRHTDEDDLGQPERREALRQSVIEWLEANGYVWQPCGHVADTSLMMSYQGQIYIDVPYDETLPEYRKLATFLEYPDGTTRLPGVDFCYLRYERALENVEHDAPGFWEKWAEDF